MIAPPQAVGGYFVFSGQYQTSEPSQPPPTVSDRKGVDRTNAQASSDRYRKVVRNIEIDAATRSVIFETVSQSTGTVVAQYPNKIQLKLRAYLATLQSAEANRA